jgi:hypothetical protein
MKLVFTLDGVTYIGDIKPLEELQEAQVDGASEAYATDEKAGRRYKPDEIRAICRDYENGMAYKDIAPMYGRTAHGIRGVIFEYYPWCLNKDQAFPQDRALPQEAGGYRSPHPREHHG